MMIAITMAIMAGVVCSCGPVLVSERSRPRHSADLTNGIQPSTATTTMMTTTTLI